MNYKRKIFFLIVIAVFFAIIGYGLTSFIKFEFNTCGSGFNDTGNLSGKINLAPSCAGYRGYLDSLDNNLGVPLALFSVVSVFILFILLFLHEQVFHAWSKFAVIFLPVAIILIAVTPEYRDVFFSFDEEAYTLFFVAVFLVASLIIIAIKSLKLRKEQK